MPQMLSEEEPATAAEDDEPADRGGRSRRRTRSSSTLPAGRRRAAEAPRRRGRATRLDAASCRARGGPWSALLFVALREVPNIFEKSFPSGPGALPPARWPAPSVLSTPRCGQIDSRGSRNPSTSRTMQMATIARMVMGTRYPPAARPANRLDSLARGEASRSRSRCRSRWAPSRRSRSSSRAPTSSCRASRATAWPPRRFSAHARPSATTPRPPAPTSTRRWRARTRRSGPRCGR